MRATMPMWMWMPVRKMVIGVRENRNVEKVPKPRLVQRKVETRRRKRMPPVGVEVVDEEVHEDESEARLLVVVDGVPLHE
jgi:hypothetical protein